MATFRILTLRRVALGCVLLAGSGCGKNDYPLAPVSGMVTLDGQPVPDARVSFEPRATGGQTLAGPGSYGKTDAAGRFTLRTLRDEPGAVIAQHTVTISTERLYPQGQENRAAGAPERIPLHYRNGEQQLEFTVPEAGTTTADFALTK